MAARRPRRARAPGGPRIHQRPEKEATMAAFSPLSRHPDEDANRRERLEDAAEAEDRLEDLLDRAAERASLPRNHPAIHRLARAERARRTGLDDGRAAA